MLKEKEIIEIAKNFIKQIVDQTKIQVIIIPESTIIKPYGTIFRYTSRKYYETRDDRYAVAGNAPFLVENKTGKIIEFGTGQTLEYYVQEYEAGRWPENKRPV